MKYSKSGQMLLSRSAPNRSVLLQDTQKSETGVARSSPLRLGSACLRIILPLYYASTKHIPSFNSIYDEWRLKAMIAESLCHRQGFLSTQPLSKSLPGWIDPGNVLPHRLCRIF